MTRQGLIPAGGEFFTLRIGYPEHDRIVSLKRSEPKWLHTVALAQCNEHLTDGHIDPFRLKIILAIADVSRSSVWVQSLVEVGLWVDLGDGHYAIRDYLDYNPSAASVKGLRESRRAAGRLGGQAKALASATASATAKVQQTPSRVEVDLEVEKKEQDLKTIVRMDEVLLVTAAWMKNAPPLIVHRESSLKDAKTTSAVEVALKEYPAEDVATAIGSYATCLAGGEYFWKHSWPIVHFLKRGLSRFVPEADPLNNFRIKDAPGQNGRDRGLSADDIFAKARELERQGR